ncbi:MAG: hypothetical protein AAGA58_14965 [Verrucomicrobiota bacterium]
MMARLVVSLCVVIFLAAFTPAQDPVSAEVQGSDQSDTEEKWVAEDDFPTTVQLFEALAARKNPRWRTLYRPPLGVTFPARTKSAFWLGVNISELYLAVHARDAQRVSNLSRDLEAFGRNLGVSKIMHDGIVTLNGHAQKGDWADAKEEVGRTSGLVKKALAEQEDGNLAVLVLCGEWIRNVEVSASVVDAEAFDDLALAAGGQRVFLHLHEELRETKFEENEEARLQLLRKKIGELSDLWKQDDEATPTMEDVNGTHAAVTEILDRFSENDSPKKKPKPRDES